MGLGGRWGEAEAGEGAPLRPPPASGVFEVAGGVAGGASPDGPKFASAHASFLRRRDVERFRVAHRGGASSAAAAAARHGLDG